jgi:ATP-dependent DNA helicase RecG
MYLELLKKPVQFQQGVGPRRTEALADAGVECIRDLLSYYPRRYLDRSNVTSIKVLKPGSDPVTIVGKVTRVKMIPARRRSRFELSVVDESGAGLSCVWFQGAAWIAKLFEAGQRVAFHGSPSLYRNSITMTHPDFDLLDSDGPSLDTGRIIALYPGSAVLSKAGLSSRVFRRVIYGLFQENGDVFEDIFPDWIRDENSLIDGRIALRAIHFPKNQQELDLARHRLKFEELFFIQMMLWSLRVERVQEKGIRFSRSEGSSLVRRFVDDVLPFELTNAQKSVTQEIFADTESGNRLNRLLQGDVGSGKTVVAVAAMLHALDNGYQGAFMAPTEILSEQHYTNLKSYFEPLGVEVRLLTGGMKKSERDEILVGMASGDVSVVVGTHAVIQKGVEFNRLGMCVIDEQHRFGVMQRATLLNKGETPHILLMTATPIPRSLALTVYGDLDVSVMKEKPPGRFPIKTIKLPETKQDEAYGRMREHLSAGQQCYVVYPLVEESEKVDLADAENGLVEIRAAFPDHRVGLVHGRMKSSEKDRAMTDFVTGRTDILVCTTVIEVGVDVPNASLMLIVHAERFGLSQLHQLRGRIGRGPNQSLCILLASFKQSNVAKDRLKAMVDTDDGFKISEMDLKLRGAGDFFGTRQSGLPDLKIADIVEDTEILIQARDVANALMARDPKLEAAEHSTLRDYYRTFYTSSKMDISRIG